jgi:hypothetical protein
VSPALSWRLLAQPESYGGFKLRSGDLAPGNTPVQARQRVGLTRGSDPTPAQQADGPGRLRTSESSPCRQTDRERQLQAHLIMRNCSGSLGSGRQDCCASAVWTKAEAAMRAAPTVAILRPTGRIGCSSCATAAVSWLFELAPQQRDEEGCCEGHCYERESELFKHVHLP